VRYKLTLVNIGGGCRCPYHASVFVHLPVGPDGRVHITDELIDTIRVKLSIGPELGPPPQPVQIDPKRYRFTTFSLLRPRKNVLIDKLL
jgi:hypothetical protein